MAIKVGGTSVISDSRVLENVTGLKTIDGTDLLGSGDITTTDEKAEVYGYAAYRSGTATLYPGFNVGTYVNFGGQGSMTATGTFTNGQYESGPNYGSNQYYGSLAVRTG